MKTKYRVLVTRLPPRLCSWLPPARWCGTPTSGVWLVQTDDGMRLLGYIGHDNCLHYWGRRDGVHEW